MKTEELTALGLTLEQAKSVLSIHGKDIEKHKAIAQQWQTTAQQAQQSAQEQIANMTFDTALQSALLSARAKNTKAVKALINLEGLSLKNGEIEGLCEQLTAIKDENGYLFEGDAPDFQIVKSSDGVVEQHTDSFIANARIAAGLT